MGGKIVGGCRGVDMTRSTHVRLRSDLTLANTRMSVGRLPTNTKIPFIRSRGRGRRVCNVLSKGNFVAVSNRGVRLRTKS